jgi:hypothetical protein
MHRPAALEGPSCAPGKRVYFGGVGKIMNSVQGYRDKAARSRRLAESVSDPLVREQLELAAKEYDEMADQLPAEDGPVEIR